jgi:hypothetical protein
VHTKKTHLFSKKSLSETEKEYLKNGYKNLLIKKILMKKTNLRKIFAIIRQVDSAHVVQILSF